MKFMKLICLRRVFVGWLGFLAFAELGNAQFFTASKGDLLTGFRKTSGGTYELVVNIGNVTNFIAVTPGTTIAVSNFTPTQLSAAFSWYNNLQWSVSAAFAGSSAWMGFPASTIWSTVARANIITQSEPPLRASVGIQQPAKNRVYGAGSGANTISVGVGSTNANNNVDLVRESVGDGNALTAFIGDPSDATLGDFQGNWYNVENVTPASFTAAQRSDLYQSCPDGTTDPITGRTTGSAYFIGYFELSPGGTLTFTRASVGPPAPVLTIQRAGNDSTISFLTTSGATYTLFSTNASGLTSPIANWASSTTNLSGDGLIHSFTDTTTEADRVYSVGAH